MYLMCKDTPLLWFDENNIKVIEENKNLLPIGLRGGVNFITLLDWINSRTINLARVNAKWVLNGLNLPQTSRYTVALACKGLSLIDSYWLKKDNQNLTWADVNLFENSISKAVAELAFTGVSNASIQGEYNTPELTGQGAYAKCWRRVNGDIYLYKANTSRGKESEAEFVCSKLLDILNIPHVNYELTTHRGKTSSRCKIITNPDLAIVPMLELSIYLGKQNIRTVDWLKKYHFKYFMQMLLFDGIVNNVDRHWNNWGIYMDSNNGNLLGLHPLFDHNCAVDLTRSDNSQIFTDKSLLDVSIYAYKQLGKPKEIILLRDWLNSKEGKKFFNTVYKNDIERQFILNRVEKLIN